jgi:hypothetical protein
MTVLKKNIEVKTHYPRDYPFVQTSYRLLAVVTLAPLASVQALEGVHTGSRLCQYTLPCYEAHRLTS